MSYHATKRGIDVLCSLIGLLLLSPLWVIIYLLILFWMGRPVVFKQQRVGYREREFMLYKFRTMSDARKPDGTLLPDRDRLTPLGSILRRTSLDELPQLWNILKGDMSFIGPRPLFVRYLPFYTERERLRHTVRPGITGLAQISGRNMIYWDDRLELDAQYVERLSLTLDLHILWKTVFVVAMRKDVAVIPGEFGVPLDQYRRNKWTKDHTLSPTG